jgi:dGTPase
MSKTNRFYSSFDKRRLEAKKHTSYRTPFQVDRDRVIHSYAFRRLQGKTQVFRPGEYDFYRTRLTHTIEVAQIGRSICAFLKNKSRYLREDFYIDSDLIEAVCLAHDIGHAPFGHAGERALNELMSCFGGFEGNAQTVRLLTKTIWHGTSPGERTGLNPTRALLDGVLKYKKIRSTVKTTNHFVYEDQQELIDFAHGETLRGAEPKSIECQIMDWADEVAYSVGDIVDGVRARFITNERLSSSKSAHRRGPLMRELTATLTGGEDIARFAAHKIGEFIEACDIEKVRDYESLATRSGRYRYKLEIRGHKREEQESLKQLSSELVFASPAVQQLEYKAQRMVKQLFEILCDNYVCPGSRKHHLLNEGIEQMFERAKNAEERARLLCDHIAGMSDDYVVRTYRRLIDPEFGSIVDLV